MCRRALFLLFLCGLVPPCYAADPVSVRITHFGLEGFYASEGSPTWIEVTLRNTTEKNLCLELSVAEVGLDNEAAPLSDTCTLDFTLGAGEERIANIPIHVSPLDHAVLYAEARDARGTPLGRAGRRVGPKTEGRILAFLCSSPELCRSMQQSILLSGSPEEQTRKSQSLRLAQLSAAPSDWWAYSMAYMVVLATSVTRLSSAQREALELYLRRGGTLVLLEDQLGDTLQPSPVSARRTDSRPGTQSPQPHFLEAYRARIPEGKPFPVGSGKLVRLRSVSNNEFSGYFRPLGFGESTPKEVRTQLEAITRSLRWEGADLPAWLMKRLGTSFHFPSFLELLLWIVSYLLLVGLVNFVILRRIGRPEWGWLTIPALAVLFSVLLYFSSARNRPRNFGLDDMIVYRADHLSPLATADAKIRLSAPVRSRVRLVVPGTMIRAYRQRNFFDGIDLFSSAIQDLRPQFHLGKTWETGISLRKWSSRDLDFEGARRFSGTVYRDSAGQLHNETGLSFDQAILVDHEDVFLLGNLSASVVVDLGHVPRKPYQQEVGRVLSDGPGYPRPPFEIRNTEHPAATEAESKQFQEEWDALQKQPFSLLELIRGWSRNADDVFYETRAVFFGLSRDATLSASLRDRSPEHKAYSLTVVTFGNGRD